jgi:glycosyltransferase involved in cell wall biosynthesis
MKNHLLPLVSIGLPTFNRVDTLRQAIESVLKQSYTNIELVISDNASTDETERVCREYAEIDSRVTYIRQSINLGPSPNFVAVLEQSHAEFFMWLCDDDWLDDTYIEQCVSVLSSDPKTCLVGGVAKYYRGSDYTYTGTVTNLLQDQKVERMLTYYKTISDNGIYYGIWRRANLLNIPLTNTMGNDWHQLAAAAYSGKIRTVEGIYIHRGLEGSTVSYTAIAEQMDLPNMEKNFPHLSIAVNAAIDICTRVPVFRELPVVSRTFLATRVFFLIVNRYIVRSLLGAVSVKVKKYCFLVK